MENTQDPTLTKDGDKPNPEVETAKEETTSEPKGESKTQESRQVVDYESKFKASQDESIRLKKENERLDEQWKKINPILQTLNDNPEIMQEVDDAYTGNSTGVQQSQTQTKVIDALVEKKVREQVNPMREAMDIDQKQRIKESFDGFTKKFPDAIKHWDKIERNLKGMKAAGYPLEQGLENAYFLAKKDEAVKQGKKEMAFEIYQRDQAAVSGGATSGSGPEDSKDLNSEESKVAEGLGIKKTDYADSKERI